MSAPLVADPPGAEIFFGMAVCLKGKVMVMVHPVSLQVKFQILKGWVIASKTVIVYLTNHFDSLLATDMTFCTCQIKPWFGPYRPLSISICTVIIKI